MAAVQGLTPLWQSNGPPVTINPGIQSFFDVFLETFGSISPPTERTPLIAVAVIDNPLAPSPLNTINLLAQTLFVMPPPPLYCYNWDFVNNTGVAVNDLHIAIRGPNVLSDVYMGPLNPFGGPGPGAGYTPTGLYTLSYSGAIVQPGGSVHTGFCSDTPAVLMTVTWTLNDLPVGQTVPVPGWQWNWQAGGGGFQIGLTDSTTSPMTVVALRRALTPQGSTLKT